MADALVALHSTDAATVYLSALARLEKPDTAEVERALYDDRTLVRMHGMRQTLFVVPADLAPVVQASTTREMWGKERGLLLRNAVDAGLDAAWLERVEAETVAEVERRGSATGAELGKAVAGLRDQVLYGKGTKWETWQPASGRVLRVLGFDGAVVRGRPVGSWLSSQHRWEPGEGHAEIAVADAQAELTRRWLRAFGPATEADLKWWTGWKVTDARKALKAVGAVQVAVGEGRAPGPVSAGCCPTIWRRSRRPSRGLRCCRAWTRRRWAGRAATGTWPRRSGRGCSTAPGTSARPCGGTARSWAAGRNALTGRW